MGENTLEKFVITGGKALCGTVDISGAKNAAVAIIPAAILIEDECIIENVPDIKDVRIILDILSSLGAKVEKLDAEAGNTVTFDQVIAVSDGSLKVGADVANASVTATVMEQGRGKKVIVYKYKRKTGYHKKNGHRQAYTQVKIDKINA